MTKNTVYFIGLGLFDENDLTLKAIDAIKNCDKIFAEFYTSTMMGTEVSKIEKKIGKPITILSRDETEKANMILSAVEQQNIAFLTGGDSMAATTHIDLRLQAIKKGFNTKIIHGTSVITAVPALLGLQQYKFGRTTTLVIPEKNYFPTSPYDVIKNNKKIGLHSLILLDIQADKNRYMSASEGIDVLLKMEEIRNESIIKKDEIACVVCQAGSDNPKVYADTILHLKSIDFGPPLHSLVIPGNLHFLEKEALEVITKNS
jgi:diphthine synthase